LPGGEKLTNFLLSTSKLAKYNALRGIHIQPS
jgi:hypothetical protein